MSGKKVHLCGCFVPRLKNRAFAALQRFDDVQNSVVYRTDEPSSLKNARSDHRVGLHSWADHLLCVKRVCIMDVSTYVLYFALFDVVVQWSGFIVSAILQVGNYSTKTKTIMSAPDYFAAHNLG